MLRIGNTLIHPAHVESARVGKKQETGETVVTLIHAKEGQKDYTGDEAKQLYEQLQEPEVSLSDLLAELKAIRAVAEDGLAILKLFSQQLPNAVKENAEGV